MVGIKSFSITRLKLEHARGDGLFRDALESKVSRLRD